MDWEKNDIESVKFKMKPLYTATIGRRLVLGEERRIKKSNLWTGAELI
jgi:hypothetical protein